MLYYKYSISVVNMSSADSTPDMEASLAMAAKLGASCDIPQAQVGGDVCNAKKSKAGGC